MHFTSLSCGSPPVPCASRGHRGAGLRRPDRIWSPAQGLRGRHTPMTCPACQIDLYMTESPGIEIDYRPQCRGVWFDRGNSANTPSARVRTAPPRLPPTGMRTSVAPPLRSAGMMTRMSATGTEDGGAHRSWMNCLIVRKRTPSMGVRRRSRDPV